MFIPLRQVNCFCPDTCLWGPRILITNHSYFVTKVTRKSCKQTLVTIGILKPNKQITKRYFSLDWVYPLIPRYPDSNTLCIDLLFPLNIYLLQFCIVNRAHCLLSCELALQPGHWKENLCKWTHSKPLFG